MNHSIKLKRALVKTDLTLSVKSEVFIKILKSNLLDQLTSDQISVVAEMLNSHWQDACEWKEQDIINNGCLWDSNNKKLVELK